MATKPEYEANIVAAEILLDTDKIFKVARFGDNAYYRLSIV